MLILPVLALLTVMSGGTVCIDVGEAAAIADACNHQQLVFSDALS
jgi:hypothetical protein